MNNATRTSSGVEIEEDIIRFRRRKLEYEADVARQAAPRRLRTRRLARAMPVVNDRWRPQR